MQRPQALLRAFAMTLAITLGGAGAASAALPDTGGADGNPSLAPLVDEVSPAVVNIATSATVDAKQNPLMQHPFFRRFFDQGEMPQRQRRVQSLGSGVIVNAQKGYILTNHHVIANADEIKVGLNDERTFKAEVIGSDPDTDIAVIQIDAENLHAVSMGDSGDLRTGDYVVALGNPFGLNHTVTTGIVSGQGRTLAGRASEVRIQDFIQTDASINPGNSGGALVNLDGELVGINSAILSRSGGNIGIGFAVPVNMAQTVMDQLVEYGEVRRGMLGVHVQDVSMDIAEAMSLEGTNGALISRVKPDSPADKAGLASGDVVIAVDGESIESASELAKVIGLTKLGTEVELTIVRDGDERTMTATITEPAEKTAQAGGGDEAAEGALAGVKLAELDPRSPLHGEVEGVVVADIAPDAPAARYLEEGDVITSVNRQPVSSLSEFRKTAQGEDRLLLHIRRGDAALYVVAR